MPDPNPSGAGEEAARESILYLPDADVAGLGIDLDDLRDAVASAFASKARGASGASEKATVVVGTGQIFQAKPGVLREFERHRLGSQTFLPLSATPYVVVVALGEPTPDPATVAAFRVGRGCGVTLRRDVWHHSLLMLADGDFAVLERRGEEVDCEVVPLGEASRWTVDG